MKYYFNLNFLLCSISINFENFESVYIEFFKKIYAVYFEDHPTYNCNHYQVSLHQNGNHFDFSGNIYEIKDLYNIIHFIVCDSICSSCNKQNLMVLHASSFMLNNKSVLLSGIKSSGKTTTLLFFLKNGAVYTGDEIVVVSSSGIIPYQLPLRAKKSTIDFLKKQFSYEYEYHSLPYNISEKKQYLSLSRGIASQKIESWIKCDSLLFLNEGNSMQNLKSLTEYEAANRLLRCIRNKGSISSGLSLLKEAKLYSTDFSVHLDELKRLLSE